MCRHDHYQPLVGCLGPDDGGDIEKPYPVQNNYWFRFTQYPESLLRKHWRCLFQPINTTYIGISLLHTKHSGFSHGNFSPVTYIIIMLIEIAFLWAESKLLKLLQISTLSGEMLWNYKLSFVCGYYFL